MKLYVRHAGGELTVPDQKEFFVLWNRGFITGDDLVRREGIERWVPASELPWIRNRREDDKADNRRLFWLTLALMVLGLGAVLWVQSHAAVVVHRAAPVVSFPPPAPGQNSVHFRAR